MDTTIKAANKTDDRGRALSDEEAQKRAAERRQRGEYARLLAGAIGPLIKRSKIPGLRVEQGDADGPSAMLLDGRKLPCFVDTVADARDAIETWSTRCDKPAVSNIRMTKLGAE